MILTHYNYILNLHLEDCKMVRKIIVLLVALSIPFAFMACGKKDKESKKIKNDTLTEANLNDTSTENVHSVKELKFEDIEKISIYGKDDIETFINDSEYIDRVKNMCSHFDDIDINDNDLKEYLEKDIDGYYSFYAYLSDDTRMELCSKATGDNVITIFCDNNKYYCSINTGSIEEFNSINYDLLKNYWDNGLESIKDIDYNIIALSTTGDFYPEDNVDNEELINKAKSLCSHLEELDKEDADVKEYINKESDEEYTFYIQLLDCSSIKLSTKSSDKDIIFLKKGVDEFYCKDINGSIEEFIALAKEISEIK